jgi:hypothetical protein
MRQLYSSDSKTRQEAYASLVNYGIWDAHSPLDAFERIFQSLADEGKNAFRSALGTALRQVNTDVYPPLGIRDLIYLIGFTEAFESLAAIPSVLADASNWDGIEAEFYFNAVAVLKGLGKSPQAYDASRRLMTTKLFPSHYIFDGYEALVLGDPSHWADDLLLFGERFISVQNWQPKFWKDASLSWFDTRVKLLADTVLGKLSLSTISTGLLKLESVSDSVDTNQPVGKLLIELFRPGGSLSRTTTSSGTVQLALPGSNIRENWPEHLHSIDTYLWSTGLESNLERSSVPVLTVGALEGLRLTHPDDAALLAELWCRDEYKNPHQNVVVPYSEMEARRWAKSRHAQLTLVNPDERLAL